MIKRYLTLEYAIYFIFFLGMVWRGIAQVLYQTPLQWLDDFQWQSWLYRIEMGQIPYRDFFVLYGFVLPYLFIIPYKILGSNFLAWNIIRYLFLPIICYILAILISKQLFKTIIFRIYFLVVAATFDAWGLFFLQPWFFRNWIGLSSFLLLFSKYKYKFVLVGACSAMLIFSSPEQGFYVFGTILILTFVKFFISPVTFFSSLNIKKITHFCLGFIPLFLLAVCFLYFTGGLNKYIFFNSLIPYMTFSHFGGIFPNFPIDKLSTNFFSFIISKEFRFYLPLFIYIFSLIYLMLVYTHHKKGGWKILFLTIFGILSFRTALGGDFGHLTFVYIPALLLIIWFLEQASLLIALKITVKQNLLGYLQICILGFFIFLASLFFYLIRSPTEKGFLVLFSPEEIITTRKAFANTYDPSLRVSIPYGQTGYFNQLLNYLNTLPQKNYYTHGSMSGLYFLTKTVNNFYYDQDYWATETEQKIIIKGLEKLNNNYVVNLNNFHLLRGSLLDDYFNYYYNVEQQFGEFSALKRNNIIYDDSFYEMGLVAKLKEGWKRNSRNEFDIALPDKKINKITVLVNMKFLPLLEMFATTRVNLGLRDINNNVEWFKSDTNFVPKNMEGGKITFHFYKKVTANKLILSFSSPGEFNPAPDNINIKEIDIYQ